MRYGALTLVLVLGAPAVSQAGPKKTARPNILILVADDWSWPHAGVYGDRVVKTPHFDRLARRGILFHRSYCVAPSCSPSRASILTGQWSHRLKEGGNLWGVLPGQYETFPDLLERSGYFIGMVGKGWGPGSLEGTGRTRNPAGPGYKGFAQFLKALPSGRPFCFWFGSRQPHRPYTAGSGLKAGLNPDLVRVLPFFPDARDTRLDILDYYHDVQRFDQQVGEILELLERAGLLENTIIIITSDNRMPFPRCKANLYDMGTHMPLAIAWPAKIKEKGQSQAFISHQDLAPTILEAAGLIPPRKMTGKSFLNLLLKGEDQGRDMVFVERERHANVRRGDLGYPSRAIRTKRYLYIRNFRPERWPAGDPQAYFAVGPFGDIDDGPTKRLIMKGMNGLPPMKKLFELSCGKRPAEELYDFLNDPGEMKNLAADPAHAPIKARLKADLEKWMRDTGDPRAGPGGGDDRWDKFKYFGGPAPEIRKEKKTGRGPVFPPITGWERVPILDLSFLDFPAGSELWPPGKR